MLQDSWLFSGTIRENIQMGFNEYEVDHVLRICKVAGVDDFVGSQPKGYDLEIREGELACLVGKRQTVNWLEVYCTIQRFYFSTNQQVQWTRVLKKRWWVL